MAYAHIENLYKRQEILAFKRCFALEKVHGTSGHLAFSAGEVRFHSGGASQKHFESLFDHANLLARYAAICADSPMTVYGEAYGGSVMKMKATYGDALRFIVFDVQIGDSWLSVPAAANKPAFLRRTRLDTWQEKLSGGR